MEINILDISDWAKAVRCNKKRKNFQKYLHLLSFNELIEETQSAVHDLHHCPLHPELIIKSQLILQELNGRVYPEQREHSSLLDRGRRY